MKKISSEKPEMPSIPATSNDVGVNSKQEVTAIAPNSALKGSSSPQKALEPQIHHPPYVTPPTATPNGAPSPINPKELDIKDCGGGGNCQFLSVAHLFDKELNNIPINYYGFKKEAKKSVSGQDFRELIANYIIHDLDDNEFEVTRDAYVLEFKEALKNFPKGDSDHFSTYWKMGWEPTEYMTREEWANHIRESGSHYEGDDITRAFIDKLLPKLSPKLKDVSIDVITKEGTKYRFGLGETPLNTKRVVGLLYDQDIKHYQAIVGKNGESVFPQEVFRNLARKQFMEETPVR